MTNLEGDESDSLIMSRARVRASSWMPPSGAQLAWNDMDLEDWDACIENPPEPKKVGKIKAIFKYIGRSKPFSGKEDVQEEPERQERVVIGE